MTIAQVKAARRKANQDKRWSKARGRKRAEQAERKRATFLAQK